MNRNVEVILLVSEFPPSPGGIGNHAYNLALYLSGKYHVTVLTEGPLKDLKDTRGNNLPFKVIRLRRKGWLPWLYLKRIGYALKLCRKAEHVIACDRFAHWNAGFVSLFVKKSRYTAITHGGDITSVQPLFKILTRIALSYRMHYIVSVSAFTAGFLPLSHKKLQKRRIIPNGINLSELKDYDNVVQKNEAQGTLKLLTIGSLSVRKGQENVIRAIPMLLSRYPELNYTMIGKPLLEKELMELAERLNVAQHLDVKGAIPTKEMFDILKQTDVFIMLSQPDQNGDFEGFGIAILEANYFGIPAIGSKGNGIEQAIRDGYNGRLVEARSPEEVLAAVNEIMAAQEMYAEQARLWAEEHDWQCIGKEYESMWAQ